MKDNSNEIKHVCLDKKSGKISSDMTQAEIDQQIFEINRKKNLKEFEKKD